MDVLTAIENVLDPEERLIWATTPPNQQGLTVDKVWLVFLLILISVGTIFQRPLATLLNPFPFYLQLEIMCIPALQVFVLWYFLHLDRRVSYAVTNKRLFIAVGTKRENVRTIDLAALGQVRIVSTRSGRKALRFRLRGNDKDKSAWKFLDSGKDDRWVSAWIVDDAESVLQLIEAARAAHEQEHHSTSTLALCKANH